MAMTAAERARAARDRKRGGPPRTPSADPLAVARRKRWSGEPLTESEAQALREYETAGARRRRQQQKEAS